MDSFQIDSNTLYAVSYIEEVVGKRTLTNLRKHGLRAVGGWYLGENVIASFRRIVEAKDCSFQSKESETKNDAKKTCQRMVESEQSTRIFPVATKRRDDNLSSQVNRIKSSA